MSTPRARSAIPVRIFSTQPRETHPYEATGTRLCLRILSIVPVLREALLTYAIEAMLNSPSCRATEDACGRVLPW